MRHGTCVEARTVFFFLPLHESRDQTRVMRFAWQMPLHTHPSRWLYDRIVIRQYCSSVFKIKIPTQTMHTEHPQMVMLSLALEKVQLPW